MLLTVIYIIAITAEAMTGALSAGRRSMDWFGVILIACVTALGGGSVRDVLLGHYPLTWVKHPEYLVLTCCAALVTILIAKWMKHLHSIFLLLDALGLIGFTIIGCQIALQMGHGFVVSAVSTTSSGALEGLGKGAASLVISLCRYVIFIMPLAWLLCRQLGPTGVWHAFWVTEVLSAVIAFAVYRKSVVKK